MSISRSVVPLSVMIVLLGPVSGEQPENKSPFQEMRMALSNKRKVI
jgi:hypothetical protein